jgi:hypothetical protein
MIIKAQNENCQVAYIGSSGAGSHVCGLYVYNTSTLLKEPSSISPEIIFYRTLSATRSVYISSLFRRRPQKCSMAKKSVRAAAAFSQRGDLFIARESITRSHHRRSQICYQSLPINYQLSPEPSQIMDSDTLYTQICMRIWPKFASIYLTFSFF